MALFEPDEWSFSEKAIQLVTTNPFDPGWRKKEAEILGPALRDAPMGIAWTPGAQLWGPQSVYSEEFDRRITGMVERLRLRLVGGASASEVELERYELLLVYRLYCQCGRAMDQWIDAAVHRAGKDSAIEGPSQENERPADVKTLWKQFRCEHDKLLRFNECSLPLKYKPGDLFACFFVFRRAFYHIFFNIVGASKPIAELRRKVWESIVTHNLLGWMQGLQERMKDFPTLITGPSGTGKERVAEAIGQSLYIPFDAKKEEFKIDFPNPRKKIARFDFLKVFLPVNLAALPPTLIESELFGTVKGAFNDAIDRIGRLEECPDPGAVFLDEIGELTPEVQVKLLRVLQTRRFQRVGENEDKVFRGKIIAATNRDLATEIHARRFREDFYYRLCADQIETPSLRVQFADHPEDLRFMVEFVCRSVVGGQRSAGLAGEVADWIQNHPRLGRGYTWPGNFRELEQCVRSYTIRKEYQPLRSAQPPADDGLAAVSCDPLAEACETLVTAVLKVKATCADELELKKMRILDQIKQRLFTRLRAHTATKQEAATLLGIDVRTLDAGMRATDGLPVNCSRVGTAG